MTIEKIRINGLIEPLGLDAQCLTVSWCYGPVDLDTVRDMTQEGFRLVLYKYSWDYPHKNAAPLSDTGFIEDGSQIYFMDNIDLEPCTKYRIWLTAKMSDGSFVAQETFMETGFLKKKTWSAKWIGARRPDPDKEKARRPLADDEPLEAALLTPVVCFEKELSVGGKQIRQARAYVTARGAYELDIDGEKTGDMELTPEFSSYPYYLQYQTYDITKQLQKEQVRVSLWLADGFYAGRINENEHGFEFGDHTSVLAQLEITYMDGAQQIFVTDESWRYYVTPIVYSDIFIGEKQDLRHCHNENLYEPVVYEDDFALLTGQAAEPLRVIERLLAKEILTTPSGETVIDFGQVICGRVCLRLDGCEGEEIILEHQETLDEAGNFYFNIPRHNREQQDRFILRNGVLQLCPQFTFHGFRYVRVTGYHQGLKKEDCTALVIGSDCEKTGQFLCSDQRLNQLQHNIQWSQKANFFSIPTDCPQRERAGWTGDIQVYGATATFNGYVLPFLKRWLAQVRCEQLDNGAVPIVVPYTKSYQFLMNTLLHADASCGWGDMCTILPWTLYMAYGDRTVLSDNYEMMERWMAYVKAQAAILPEGEWHGQALEYQKYLWNTGFHFGDWLYPSAKDENGVSDPFLSSASTRELVAPVMYAYSAKTMEKICTALEKWERAAYYGDLYLKIKEAYNAMYVKADGRIEPELQGIYVLALQMDLIDQPLKQKSVSHLVRLIRENNRCLDTGFLSVPFLLDVLYDHGEKELAYELLYNEQCPSWLYEVKMGATTMWESWDALRADGKPSEISFNHFAYGCVGDWIYRRILGLSALAPGYERFLVKPDFDCGLTWVRGSYTSVYGEISIAWQKSENGVTVDLKIPVNTRAEVELVLADRCKKVSIGSGIYQFTLNGGL